MIPPFIAKYGIRFLLIGGLAGSLFVGGCMYSDKQHAEHAADIEKQKTALIAQRTEELNAEWRAKLLVEENARMALQFDLSIIQEHRDSLIQGIRDAQLTKPTTSLIFSSSDSRHASIVTRSVGFVNCASRMP